MKEIKDHSLSYKIDVAKELYVNWLSHDDPEKLEPRIENTKAVVDLAFHLATVFVDEAKRRTDENYQESR